MRQWFYIATQFALGTTRSLSDCPQLAEFGSIDGDNFVEFAQLALP